MKKAAINVQTNSECGSSCSESYGSPGSPPRTPPSTDPSLCSEASAVAHPPPLAPNARKTSRNNTQAEKRKMRIARNKRKRKVKRLQGLHSRIKGLEKDLDHAQNLLRSGENKVKHFKHVSRTYWERWRWELEKRRESANQRRSQETTKLLLPTKQHRINHIDAELIKDTLVDGVPQEVYLGRGSFGIVRLQTYRGIDVAVKELLPRSAMPDLMHEAQILASLCHPNLPYLFGVCTKSLPLRLVMQFHGFRSEMKSRCLWQEIEQPTIPKDDPNWIFLFAHVLEAVRYLHNEAKVLHNDITLNNVVMSRCENHGCSENLEHQLILIDFGKATSIAMAKVYRLTDSEKDEYARKYPHIAPEVISGETPQTKSSDMFSIGKILHNLLENSFFPPNHVTELYKLADQCKSIRHCKRPTAVCVLSVIQAL